jgi:hypothetical protein
MSRDFGNWNNEPVHSTPEDIERIFRADDKRRERRRQLLAVALILIAAAIVLWCALGS